MADIVKRRVRDWPALDAAHRNRGELIALFFDPRSEALRPASPTGKRGAPKRYGDPHIEGLLTVKLVGAA